ncbi:MAG: RDD family protein [Bacteroidota bacterium]
MRIEEEQGPYELAKIWQRTVAFIIDNAVIVLCIVPYILLFGEPRSDDSYGVNGLPAFFLFVILFLYWPLLEGLYGQTLGKRILKIKVIDDSNKPVSLSQAFLRFLIGLIDYSCLYVGLIVAADHPLNKRLGDIVAKTIVVKEQ